ncbi:MAG: YHYH protein [Fimbriimonadaceae bacterium]|nr:YHYH protein [Fimbriimonadaceae bacterium]
MILTLTFLAQSQLFKNEVKIEVMGQYRYIKSNGIPDHETGRFPNQGNPNSIRPQTYVFKVPVAPKENERATALGHQDFGVSVQGVPFDPLTAEYWNRDRQAGWNYEAIFQGQGTLGIDKANAHVQPTGAYHYHSVPIPMIKDKTKMTLIGWAADGFPMYGPYCPTDPMNLSSPMKSMKGSYQLKTGSRPSNPGPGGTYDGRFVQDWQYVSKSGDLDECNGRFGFTPEFPKGTYYYVVTENYPWIPRYYRGTPDSSFARRPGGPPGGPGGRPGGPPPPGGGGEEAEFNPHTHSHTHSHTH